MGAGAINSLFFGSTGFYAAGAGGLSSYNFDGSSPSWTTNTTITTAAINGVYVFGSYTYVAADQLYVFNGTKQEAGTPYAPLNIVAVAGSTTVTAVMVDSNQDVFAATNKGLNVLYSGTTAFPSTPILSGTAVYGLFFDSQGNLYAASAGGLKMFGATTGTPTTILTGQVNCVSVDGAGTIYAGTNSGLEISRDSGKTWTASSWSAKVNAVVTTAPLYSY